MLKSTVFLASILFASISYAEDGAQLYKNTCESCHGDKMDGNGPIGKALTPKPTALKDFTTAQLIQVMKYVKKVDGDKKEILMMMGIKVQVKSDAERKAIADYINSKAEKKNVEKKTK